MTIVHPMSDEKPDPLSDVIRGLGLLLRAAKTTVERVPTKGLEEAVLETAREVGRALENVAGTLDREVFGRKGGRAPDEAAEPADKPGNGDKAEPAGPAEPEKHDDPDPPRAG